MTRRFLLFPRTIPVWLGIISLATLAVVGCAKAATLTSDSPVIMALGSATDVDAFIDEIVPQMNNHTDPNGPLYTGEFAAGRPHDRDELLIVSYNLRYGEAIDQTIQAYREANPLPEADIVLLQEMDEAGVRVVARELGYNYAYFPASVAEDGDNFGNAILARWPISDPYKLILPGLHPLTGQQRTATRATVTVGDTTILVYSTHIEVATAPPALREAQFAAILEDIPESAARVIVGGDFNTVTGWGVGALAEQFAAAGLDHASAGLGPTFTRFGMRPSATDHLFSRGFERLDAGVLSGVTASDHFPVWARFAHP